MLKKRRLQNISYICLHFSSLAVVKCPLKNLFLKGLINNSVLERRTGETQHEIGPEVIKVNVLQSYFNVFLDSLDLGC